MPQNGNENGISSNIEDYQLYETAHRPHPHDMQYEMQYL